MEDQLDSAPVYVKLTPEEAEFVVSLIDAVSQRGAIQGNELFAVGQIRNSVATKLAEAVKA